MLALFGLKLMRGERTWPDAVSCGMAGGANARSTQDAT